MESLSHVTLGALAGLGYAHQAHLGPASASTVMVVAALTATLPDVCQASWWRSLDKYTPDEVLGNGGPLQHRGISHWFGIPLGLWLVVLPQAVGWAHLILAGAIVGVASHLAGDLVVGKGGYGRGPGIPLMPWWMWVGIGLDCGGPAERLLIRPALLIALLPAMYIVIIGGMP